MMLYKNTKEMVRLPDGDTNFFDIVTGILQRDTLASYLARLRVSNVHRSNKRKMVSHLKRQEAEDIP